MPETTSISPDKVRIALTARSPATFDAQVRQTLDNVKAIVESAGLTMENVVYTQVYLKDISKYGDMNRVFAEYFPKTPPARAVLGVAGVPESPIQINAVAVRNLAERRAISPHELQIGRYRFAGHSHSRPALRLQHAWQRSGNRQGSGRSGRASRSGA